MGRDPKTHAVTRLLEEAASGRAGAVDELMRRVYTELEGIAAHHLRGERKAHTLAVSDLVHEAWLRLAGAVEEPGWVNRAHFYHAAAAAMRRVLIDHARRRGRVKRGGGWRRITFGALELATSEDPTRFLAVDEVIRRLEEEDERLGQVVRLRFFSGLSVEETARALGTSVRTVMRDWTFARAWLVQALDGAESGGEEEAR